MENFISYRASVAETYSYFDTSRTGLDDATRKARFVQYGANVLQKTHVLPARAKFLNQFKDLMIVLLIVTAGLSLYLQDHRTAIILSVIVLVNALIGYLQEAKAERMLDALQKMVHPDAKVLVDGKLHEVASEFLVPGDIVYIEEGDAIPADLRLVEEHNLQTNDFSLTGESNPQKKHTHAISNTVALGDRTNLVFTGTTVALGQARGVVVATGMHTELGRIAQLSENVDHDLSPLQKELNHVAKKLTLGTIILGAVLFVIALSLQLSVNEALLFAIGIAASMVPQGMPAQISVALSSAAARLAHKQALVKKLSSVETLGAVNVICTDKTGTLTQNEMTVLKICLGGTTYEVTGVGYENNGIIKGLNNTELSDYQRIFFQTGVAASNAQISPPDEEHATWYSIGDPTEAALLTLATKAGIDIDLYHETIPEIQEFSFDSARKRMSSVRRLESGLHRLYCKGALTSILPIATHYFDGQQVRPITDADKTYLESIDAQRAGEAMRNLCYAYKELPGYTTAIGMDQAESKLIVLGMVSMIDPPRSTVADAIDACHDAHIKIVIITGDYARTAAAIGHQIHLDSHGATIKVVESSELPGQTDQQLIDTIAQFDSVIFSRMSPEDKIRIVRLCKQAGRLVAVTGDGVNDSPALKQADIGVAMGMTGTDVAKDAAEIILLDDSFATLVEAIKEGRTIFQNLQKTVLSSMTSNGGELAAVLLGIVGNALFGWPLAITAVQILAIDLLGEMLPLAALTWDPPQDKIMQQPARDINQHILTKPRIIDIIWSGVLMGGLAFVAYLLHYYAAGVSLGSVADDAPFYLAGMSMTYLTIVLCQFMNILSRRTAPGEHVFTRYLWSNSKLLRAFAASLFMIGSMIYNPWIGQYVGMSALSLIDLLIAGGAAGVFLVIREIAKQIAFRQISSGPAGQYAYE